MKKLSQINNFLSRDEMKQIQGGRKPHADDCLDIQNFCVSQGSQKTCCTGSHCSTYGGSHWGVCKHDC